MTLYPEAIDNDSSIIRVDDNLSEIGGQVINQIRSAIFSIEKELGITPSGTLSSIADRLSVSLNPNGTIKASALTSVGLVTLPITNAHIANNAGILESKLSLDFSTTDLNAALQANTNTINTLSSFTAIIEGDLLTHISGGNVLADGVTPGRHVASHIDLNAVPSDPRDISFNWTGLLDKHGNLRAANTVAEALLEINNDFTSHQNDTDGGAHLASGISVDTSGFSQIPQNANTVQKALKSIDDANALIIGTHQANLHSSGVPKKSKAETLYFDGYNENIIPPTPATAFLVTPPASGPVDNNSSGDDIISFVPDNTGFIFDNLFSTVSVGDVVRVNYGNGIESIFIVESKRHLPGVEWIIRINGKNLFNTNPGEAIVRIDKSQFTKNKYGVLAAAAANNNIDPSIMGSIIVGNPMGASALGLSFDPTQLDSSHYNLYLNLYPTGNPEDKVISLPAIDVTGNQGTTPGKYTLSSVVQATNNKLRAAGYNFRFIAYAYEGNFGIMLADAINGASFSIVNGAISGASLVPGGFSNNVVGDAVDGKDALGFGKNKIGLASPDFVSSFSSENSASEFSTIIIHPSRNKHFIADGVNRDRFSTTYLTNKDGYWDGYISNRVSVGATTVETTYTVEMDLSPAGLMPGKTIVIQPEVDFDSPLYNDVDYGRFIIKAVQFKESCGNDLSATHITVLNSRHASTPVGMTAMPELPVRIYFSDDSVGFNALNLVDASSSMVDFVRHHEIFADKNGKMFSHERARLIKQNESAELLRTSTNWKIISVSPKFKGYRDVSSSDFNKYIRFYVLNYNQISGEYDGYIGQRVVGQPTIEKTGKIVTGRKNVPTKFYDASNIDFIELVYVDTHPYPGLDIISTNVPRYVDIEIFPTLAQNQELMRISSCNLNDNIVEDVVDLREFGNVSTDDLSTSAIKFIESGDRLLHQNGVLSGLDFIGEDDIVEGLLYFNGGQALVNGHISSVNEQSISIPEIIVTNPNQVVLDWAICVNEHGALEAILLSDTKSQSFVARPSGGASYYIPSVTFAELIHDRRDLTPIYIANVTIASVTVNSVSDVRMFVKTESANAPLVLYGKDSEFNNIRGNFDTFEQVFNWVSRFRGLSDSYVKVKGNIVIDNEVDLTNLNSPIVLDGIDGNNITVNSAVGLRVRNNIKLKNINFNYEANVGGLSGTSNIHVNVDAGCVVIDTATGNSDGVEISGCIFNRSATSQRPPFIHARVNYGRVFSNVVIEKNKFYSVSNNAINSAISITNTGFGTGDTGYVKNVTICGNYADNNQYITMTNADTSRDKALGINNVHIENNNIYVVGFYVTSDFNAPTEPGELTIQGNDVNFIFTSDGDGKLLSTVSDVGTGNVNISNNIGNSVRVAVYYNSDNHKYSSLLVSKNTLRAFNGSFANSNFGLSSSTSAIHIDGTGIAITPGALTYDSVRVLGNDIDRNEDYAYNIGINTDGPALISNNVVKGFDLAGVLCTSVQAGNLYSITVSNNHIYRGLSDSVLYYVGTLTVSNQHANLIVVDNVFDDYRNGSSSPFDDVVLRPSDTSGSGQVLIERNVNQTSQLVLSGFAGKLGLLSVSSLPSPVTNFTFLDFDSTPISVLDQIERYPRSVRIALASGQTGSFSFAWGIELSDVLPQGASLVSVVCTCVSPQSSIIDTQGRLILGTTNPSGTASFVLNSGDIAIPQNSVNGVDISISSPSGVIINKSNSYYLLLVIVGNKNSVGAAGMSMVNFTITYRY